MTRLLESESGVSTKIESMESECSGQVNCKACSIRISRGCI